MDDVHNEVECTITEEDHDHGRDVAPIVDDVNSLPTRVGDRLLEFEHGSDEIENYSRMLNECIARRRSGGCTNKIRGSLGS